MMMMIIIIMIIIIIIMSNPSCVGGFLERALFGGFNGPKVCVRALRSLRSEFCEACVLVHVSPAEVFGLLSLGKREGEGTIFRQRRGRG